MAPWPEPRLTLSATTTPDETGLVVATFTVANAKGTTAQVWPGDGSGPVPVTLTSGTGTVEHRYTDAGHHVYTAVATAPMTALYGTWQALADANTTWDAVPDAFDPWRAADQTEETATTTVTVDVGDATVSAVVIDAAPIPFIQVNCWFGYPSEVIGWTLTRQAPGAVPAQNVVIYTQTAAQELVQVSDREAPIGIPVTYKLTVRYSSGRATTTDVSNTVIITGVTGCFLTAPQTGQTMAIEVQAWDERKTSVRRSVLEISGRTDPIVLSDVVLLPEGNWNLLTRTREQLDLLYSILSASRLVLLRTQPASSLRTVYAAVGDFTEERVYPADGTAWERYMNVTIQEVMPTPATARLFSTTWTQVSGAYATWLALAEDQPSWLDVAMWNPAAVTT
jgi:hypothetical protein